MDPDLNPPSPPIDPTLDPGHPHPEPYEIMSPEPVCWEQLFIIAFLYITGSAVMIGAIWFMSYLADLIYGGR